VIVIFYVSKIFGFVQFKLGPMEVINGELMLVVVGPLSSKIDQSLCILLTKGAGHPPLSKKFSVNRFISLGVEQSIG
jgi:hypothetical protein